MKQYTYASLSLLVTAYILTLGSGVQAAYTDAGRTQDVVVKTDAATAAARSESLETTIISKRDIENKAAKSVEEVIFSEPVWCVQWTPWDGLRCPCAGRSRDIRCF